MGQLLVPAEGFGQVLFALRAKNGLIMLFLPILGHFWCALATLVTFSSNPNDFERKNIKKYNNNTKKSTTI